MYILSYEQSQSGAKVHYNEIERHVKYILVRQVVISWMDYVERVFPLWRETSMSAIKHHRRHSNIIRNEQDRTS